MSKTDPTLDFIMRILRVTAFDYCDSIWWRTDEPEYSPLTVFVGCNDFFYPAADAEEITPNNLELFEQSFADCEAIGGVGEGGFACVFAPMLFVARVRKMRPRKSRYPKPVTGTAGNGPRLGQEIFPAEQAEALAALFDACAPEQANAI